MSTTTIIGSCNCGKVQLSIPKPKETVLCHCMSCRKSSGSVASANFVVDPDEMHVKRSPSTYVAKGDSGRDVTRHFCGNCGSPIYTATADPKPVFVKGGLFNKGDVPSVSTHLYAKNMEEWEVAHDGSTTLDAGPPS